jgi:hypothetical protein
LSVFQEYYYQPLLQTFRTWYDDGSPGSASSSVAASKYRYHAKPSNTNNPKRPVDGFRLPAGWSMVWKDSDTVMHGGIYYRHGTSYPYTHVQYTGRLPVGHYEVPYIPDNALYARAELDALLKLKDEKVNVGVSLGERRQVADMMLSNLSKVAKSYRAFRRGNFPEAARALGLGWRDAPNRWLEYQYGWKPLLSDIHTAVEAISEKDRKDPKRTWLHVNGYAHAEEKRTSSYGTGFTGVSVKSQDTHSNEAKVRFDFVPHPDMGLQRTLDQWGISNPLQIAWELIPFSFVVDWAVPIGDFLSAMGASRPYVFGAGSQTRFTHAQRVSGLHNSGLDPTVIASGEGRSEIKVMYRYVYYAFPFPDARALLANRNPEQRTIATRVANALSILSGSVR